MRPQGRLWRQRLRVEHCDGKSRATAAQQWWRELLQHLTNGGRAATAAHEWWKVQSHSSSVAVARAATLRYLCSWSRGLAHAELFGKSPPAAAAAPAAHLPATAIQHRLAQPNSARCLESSAATGPASSSKGRALLAIPLPPLRSPSSTALLSCPESSAASRSASTRCGPRLTLTSSAPRGSAAKSLAFRMPLWAAARM